MHISLFVLSTSSQDNANNVNLAAGVYLSLEYIKKIHLLVKSLRFVIYVKFCFQNSLANKNVIIIVNVHYSILEEKKTNIALMRIIFQTHEYFHKN